jgi:hypothetical protein
VVLNHLGRTPTGMRTETNPEAHNALPHNVPKRMLAGPQALRKVCTSTESGVNVDPNMPEDSVQSGVLISNSRKSFGGGGGGRSQSRSGLLPNSSPMKEPS